MTIKPQTRPTGDSARPRVRDFLAPQRVACALAVTSKKRMIETLGALLETAAPEVAADAVLLALTERERLGSTGVGAGVALPHGRLAGLQRPLGAFVTASTPVDFDSVDGQPVDLVFALLVPEKATDEHLKILARLAGLFHDPALRLALRQAGSGEELYRLLTARDPA